MFMIMGAESLRSHCLRPVFMSAACFGRSEELVFFEPSVGPVLTSGSLAFTPDCAGKMGMTRPRAAIVVKGQEGAA